MSSLTSKGEKAMLYIIYGTAAKIGNKSREFFERHDFRWIQKETYVLENGMIIGRDKKCVTADEIDRCQYSYNVLNRKVGFNEQDIVNAVYGKERRLLTVSTDNIDVVKNLKDAFGDYVVLIYAHIYDNALKTTLLDAYPDMPQTELDKRAELGRNIKNVYADNAALFDETVVFGGEFGYPELEKQYKRIIDRYDELEKKLNNSKYVELPYTGKRGYVFISYSHDDRLRVYPILKMLQLNKCRIWYDADIQGGENWRKTIRTKIRNSKLVLLFSSEKSHSSPYVMYEYTEAQSFDKDTLIVHLDDKGFPKGYEGLQYLDIEADKFDKKLIDGIADKAKSTFTVKPKK